MTFVVLLPWQLSRLQSHSVKNQISPFATLLSGTEVLGGNRHASHMVLTHFIRWLGVDDGSFNSNIKTGPTAKLLSWQQHHSYHLILSSYIISVYFYHFSCTVNYIITFLICIIQGNEKQYSQKESAILCILKSLSSKQQLQTLSQTL